MDSEESLNSLINSANPRLFVDAFQYLTQKCHLTFYTIFANIVILEVLKK